MKILIAGDFCPQGRVAELIEEEKFYDVFGEVQTFTKQADLSIVNLEAPVVVHEAKCIDKCGPCLKGTAKSVDAIKYAGFNVATLANNHFYDYGEVGVNDTLQACCDKGIITVGGGLNLHHASQTVYFDVNDKKLAIINCCEHEFSIATNTSGGSNLLNPIQQYYAIQEARQKANNLIVVVHGGHEHYQLPSPRMKETYRFFIDAGADAVINHHQHCYTGYEVYKGKPIFYGLGNFCFDRGEQAPKFWQEGYMVMLNINDDEINFDLIPYVQARKEPGINIISNRIEFDSEIARFNITIADDKQLKEEHLKWMDRTSKGYLLTLEPYHGRILSGLYVRNLLPKFVNKKKALRIINYIQCEAHLDRLIYMLKNRIND